MNIQDAIHNIQESTATLTFLENEEKTVSLTYAQLYEEALFLLGALQDKGLDNIELKNSAVVALRFGKLRGLVTALWACWLGSLVPVFSPMPNELLLTDDDFLPSLPENKTIHYKTLTFARRGEPRPMRDEDRALLQPTSGSTAAPKRVVLTGANLWEGALASSIVVRQGVRERFLSWLPLSHIFGLVGCHLVPLFNGLDQFLIDTNLFLKDPSIWLRTCGEWGCTVTGSSQFGLKLALRAVRESNAPLSLGLETINVCFCGGETLKASVLFDFEREMSRFGWRKGVLCPAYGLSEATMGVSCKSPGEGIRVDYIDPSSVAIGERLRFRSDEDVAPSLERVSVGVLDACNEAKIRASCGGDLPQEHLGVVHLKGSNICAGYEPTAAPENPDSNGWLNTGDLGYFRDKQLTIFARLKEMICHNGLNYPLPDLEASAAKAGGMTDFALVETHDGMLLFGLEEDESALYRGGHAVADIWNIPVAGVVVLSQLPRTAKGSIDRLALAVAWEADLYKKRSSIASFSSGFSEREIAMADIWSKILRVPSSTLSPDSSFMETGGDSLALFDLAAAIEQKWGVYAETEELREARTLKKVVSLVDRLL